VGSELRGEPPGRAPEEGVQEKKKGTATPHSLFQWNINKNCLLRYRKLPLLLLLLRSLFVIDYILGTLCYALLRKHTKSRVVGIMRIEQKQHVVVQK